MINWKAVLSTISPGLLAYFQAAQTVPIRMNPCVLLSPQQQAHGGGRSQVSQEEGKGFLASSSSLPAPGPHAPVPASSGTVPRPHAYPGAPEVTGDKAQAPGGWQAQFQAVRREVQLQGGEVQVGGGRQALPWHKGPL